MIKEQSSNICCQKIRWFQIRIILKYFIHEVLKLCPVVENILRFGSIKKKKFFEGLNKEQSYHVAILSHMWFLKRFSKFRINIDLDREKGGEGGSALNICSIFYTLHWIPNETMMTINFDTIANNYEVIYVIKTVIKYY